MNTPYFPDADTLYTAIMKKDSAFEGLFYFAVRTTGIFCRPTCHAKKPKQENVAFFKSTQEALNDGFRLCKLCKPMSPAGELPGWLKGLLKEIQDNPAAPLNDSES